MILEKITKLDESKRKIAAYITVLGVICICYFAITGDSITKLKAANASLDGIETEYAGIGDQKTELADLQKQVIEKENHLQKHQEQCFTAKRALNFFENINTMARAYDLKPISRIISEAKHLVDDKAAKKAADKNTPPKDDFLKTQSANIVVSGNYFDIVEFMDELTDRSQIVYITNLRINLSSGEKYNPRASFKISLVIDLYKDMEK